MLILIHSFSLVIAAVVLIKRLKKMDPAVRSRCVSQPLVLGNIQTIGVVAVGGIRK